MNEDNQQNHLESGLIEQKGETGIVSYPQKQPQTNGNGFHNNGSSTHEYPSRKRVRNNDFRWQREVCDKKNRDDIKSGNVVSDGTDEEWQLENQGETSRRSLLAANGKKDGKNENNGEKEGKLKNETNGKSMESGGKVMHSPQAARPPVQKSITEWSCNHYERNCTIKFPCCEEFYSCHRCHNNSDQCKKDDMKGLDGTHLCCLVCNTEQEITEDSHHCINCYANLAEYFCGICKLFTGDEKSPFHCGPCGICRIHKDTTFHCNICNVCMFERMRNNHKCRSDSGHDECCICLEDAFGGCQILPCSHKVHRKCAVAMLRNGLHTCPVCRHPINLPLQQ